MALHHNKEVFPNPLTWNVDNFSPENVSSRHKSSFLPFSTGPRGCIGKYINEKISYKKIILNVVI